MRLIAPQSRMSWKHLSPHTIVTQKHNPIKKLLILSD